MSKDKEIKKPSIIGGEDSYNPNKEKEEEEKIYTSPIKIGKEEYIVKPLSMFEIKQISLEKEKIKKDDVGQAYDFTFFSMLTVLKKFNPDKTKDWTVVTLEKLVDALEFEDVLAAISQISGLKKLFKLGASKR